MMTMTTTTMLFTLHMYWLHYIDRIGDNDINGYKTFEEPLSLKLLWLLIILSVNLFMSTFLLCGSFVGHISRAFFLLRWLLFVDIGWQSYWYYVESTLSKLLVLSFSFLVNICLINNIISFFFGKRFTFSTFTAFRQTKTFEFLHSSLPKSWFFFLYRFLSSRTK